MPPKQPLSKIPDEIERDIVQSLNERYCFVRDRGKYWDFEAKQWLTEIELGRRESGRVKIKGGGQNPKEISVWMHSRYRKEVETVGFAPWQEKSYSLPDGRNGVNLWEGWKSKKGDVRPFLELTEAIFARQQKDLRSFPLDLVRFHVHSPHDKIPIALCLLGAGPAKDLWLRCILEALKPYSEQVNARHFRSSGYEWADKCLFAVMQEAKDCLSARIGRDCLTQFIIARDLPEASQSRRIRQKRENTVLTAISGPPGMGELLYEVADKFFMAEAADVPDALLKKVSAWLDKGGGERLMNWLVENPVDNFTVPYRAPVTADSYLARVERLGPIGRLAEDMKSAKVNTVALWINESIHWAKIAVSSGGRQAETARSMLTVLPQIQIRPWYTAEELCGIFPHMAYSLLGVDYKVWSPGWLSQHLRKNGVYHLSPADDPRGFLWKERWRQFLVVADHDKWREPVTQKQFEGLIGSFPKFGDLEK